jgi:hypothetical protein
MPPKTEIALPPLHISQGDIRCDQLCNGDRVRERRFRPRLPPPLHDVQFMGDAYRARPATLGDLSAVQLCGKFGTVTRLGWPDSLLYCTCHPCPPGSGHCRNYTCMKSSPCPTPNTSSHSILPLGASRTCTARKKRLAPMPTMTRSRTSAPWTTHSHLQDDHQQIVTCSHAGSDTAHWLVGIGSRAFMATL